MKYIDCNGNELVIGSEIELTAGSCSENRASRRMIRCTISPFTVKYLVKEGLAIEVKDCECEGSDNGIDKKELDDFIHEKFPLHCKFNKMVEDIPEKKRVVECWNIIQESRQWSKQFRNEFIRNLDRNSKYSFLMNSLMQMLSSETNTEYGSKFYSKEKDAELVCKMIEYYDPGKKCQ